MIVYPENPAYKQFGTELQTVTRCVCGHVMEWHYCVGEHGGMLFKHDPDCECSTAEWDGEEPAQLPSVKSWADWRGGA